MAITVNENEQFAGTEFTPFNDTDQPRVEAAITNFVSATQGYDTTVYDRFRQGVSMRTGRHVYSTTQPKIWSGNLKHAIKVVTIGQARDFTEFENDPKFEELPEFNPVWYIQDPDYPFPIIFNNGPQQEEEAIVEPFTIPFRKTDVEGPFYPRTPKASLEDGNNFDNLDGGTTRVLQFIEYDPPREPRFFLDEGQEYYGRPFPTGSLLNTRFDPIALYTFNGDITDKSGNGNDLFLSAMDSGTSTLTFDESPYPGVQAVYFDGNTAFTASVTSSMHLTGAVTTQAVLFHRPQANGGTVAGGGRTILTVGAGQNVPDSNRLFSMNISPNNINDSVGFFIEFNSGSNYIAGSEQAESRPNVWEHHALTRDDAGNTKYYVNGALVFSASHPGVPTIGPSPTSFLTVGTIPVGTFPSFVYCLSGAISSLKVIGRELTAAEILSEADLALPYESGLWNRILQESIVVEGYTAFNQRDVDPFDDTRDESIVEQISTTDTTFITRLKELDFDLSEDIRGTFDRKSATAGGDVYGPDAARYGTDSIAYRGLIRGS